MATLFNDTLFGQTIFDQLTDILLPLNVFSTDISSEVVAPGSAVVVPLFGNVTSTSFVQGASAYEGTGGTISAITVTMDKRYITPVDLTPQQIADSSNARRLEGFAQQLANATANKLLQDVFSVLTTTNFGNAILTTASANYARAQLVTARQKMLQAGVRGTKAMVINTDVEAALLGDDKITLALNRGDAMAIKEGQLGHLLGFDIYASDVLPTNSISLIGFCAGKEGVAVAMRNLGNYLPAEEYASFEQFVDADSGISMLYTRHWNRSAGKWFINTHVLFGYSAAVTGAVKLFTTPTT
jgi:hypothetical protein